MNLLKITVLTIVLLLLVCGCGFKPRGSGFDEVAGQTVYLLSKNPHATLERGIRNKLEASSVKVITENHIARAESDNSQVGVKQSIGIIDVKTLSQVLSVDINGRPAEYEITVSVTTLFDFIGVKQSPRDFSVRRNYRYNLENNLAYARERENLELEMFNDLSYRIVSQYLKELSGKLISPQQNNF